MATTRWIATSMVVAIALAACGGGDDSDTADSGSNSDSDTADDAQDVADDDNPTDSSTPADPEPAPGEDADAGEASSPVPVVRFAAHGPQADNTIGPGCATGIDSRGGDVFRFTPPPEFSWGGTSGGTGSDRVEIRSDDISLFITESAYDYDTANLPAWQVIGPSGTEVEIDGVKLSIMEVSLDGNAGYALVDIDYLSPMPVLQTGAALGTVAVTSRNPGRPTLDEAEQILGSVRIERCAAVAETLIWGPADGSHLVARFEPDPLGKAYPEQPQPAYVPGVSPLESYSLEQLAYLMPVEADVAACAAAAAREEGVGNPIAYLFMLAPTGTNQEQLNTIVANC